MIHLSRMMDFALRDALISQFVHPLFFRTNIFLFLIYLIYFNIIKKYFISNLFYNTSILTTYQIDYKPLGNYNNLKYLSQCQKLYKISLHPPSLILSVDTG